MAKRPFLRGERALFLALFCTIVLFNIPYGRLVLYPFALLATWFHEMAHGLTAAILGADFEQLVIAPDTSGFAAYRFGGDFGRISRAITASAGYVGTSIVGGILLGLRQRRSMVKGLLSAIGLALIVSALWVVLRWPGTVAGRDVSFWMPVFGGGVTIGWGAVLLWTAQKGREDLRLFLYNLIAAQTALNAVTDIRVLFSVSGGSDAHTLAELLLLPASIWATIWLALAFVFALGGYWIGRPKTA